MIKKSNRTSQAPRSQQTVQIAEQRTTVSGPIPSADEMARFKAVDPELINRIVSLAEKEATNRHKMESSALTANIEVSFRAQTWSNIWLWNGSIGGAYMICYFNLDRC